MKKRIYFTRNIISRWALPHFINNADGTTYMWVCSIFGFQLSIYTKKRRECDKLVLPGIWVDKKEFNKRFPLK